MGTTRPPKSLTLSRLVLTMPHTPPVRRLRSGAPLKPGQSLPDLQQEGLLCPCWPLILKRCWSPWDSHRDGHSNRSCNIDISVQVDARVVLYILDV